MHGLDQVDGRTVSLALSCSSLPKVELVPAVGLGVMLAVSLHDVKLPFETFPDLDRYAVFEGLLYVAGRLGIRVRDEQCRNRPGDPAGNCPPAFPILAASTLSRNP